MSDPSGDVCPNPDDPDYVAGWSKYIHLKDQCIAKERGLIEEYGPGARLDRLQSVEARLQMLANAVLPLESVTRIQFEIQWYELVLQSLERMHNDLTMARKAAREEQQAAANRQKLLLPDGFRLPGV